MRFSCCVVFKVISGLWNFRLQNTKASNGGGVAVVVAEVVVVVAVVVAAVVVEAVEVVIVIGRSGSSGSGSSRCCCCSTDEYQYCGWTESFRTVHKPTFSDSPRPPVNVCGEKPRAGFVPVAEVLHLSTGPSCQR